MRRKCAGPGSECANLHVMSGINELKGKRSQACDYESQGWCKPGGLKNRNTRVLTTRTRMIAVIAGIAVIRTANHHGGTETRRNRVIARDRETRAIGKAAWPIPSPFSTWPIASRFGNLSQFTETLLLRHFGTRPGMIVHNSRQLQIADLWR